jgi:drug/metabolite transporter superfamily protein YnfA
MGIKPLGAALSAAALGFCLLFSGCVLYPNDGFSTDPKSIIITGFPGSSYSGRVAAIMLSPSFESLAAEKVTARGGMQVFGATTLNFSLFTDENMTSKWNGTGDFIVMLGVSTLTGNVEKMWLYSDVTPNYTGANVPKFSITDTVSTIPFTDFIDVTDYLSDYL